MNMLRAEELLAGSYLLEQVNDLRDSLQYKTDDKHVAFDDHFLHMQGEIDKIKRIALMDSIPALQGSKYENELLTGLEEIQDQIEKWQIKVIRFQGDLTRAKADIDELAIGFESWYFVAASELLAESTVKLPGANLKALATSEFNRLMGRANLRIDSLLDALKIEIKRLDSKRKMARQKFEMGRDQVNATWANILPETLGISSAAPAFGLLQSGVMEEEPESIPSYVSRTGEVKRAAVSHNFDDVEPQAGTEDGKQEAAFYEDLTAPAGDFDDDPLMTEATQRVAASGAVYILDPSPGTFCGQCDEPQMTTTSGVTCTNGHGGAEELDQPRMQVCTTAEGDEVETNRVPTSKPVPDSRIPLGINFDSVLVHGRPQSVFGQHLRENFDLKPGVLYDVEIAGVEDPEPGSIHVSPSDMAALAEHLEAHFSDEALQPQAGIFKTGDPQPAAVIGESTETFVEEDAPAPEIKGTFVKTGEWNIPQEASVEPVEIVTKDEREPVTLERVAAGMACYEAWKAGATSREDVTSLRQDAERSGLDLKDAEIDKDSVPTQRKDFGFDDFDDLDEAPVATSKPTEAPTPEPVIEALPDPEPVVSAPAVAAKPKKVFDFDDDDLDL